MSIEDKIEQYPKILEKSSYFPNGWKCSEENCTKKFGPGYALVLKREFANPSQKIYCEDCAGIVAEDEADFQ